MTGASGRHRDRCAVSTCGFDRCRQIAEGLALPVPLLTSGHGDLATAIIGVLLAFLGLPHLMRGTLIADYYGSAAYARASPHYGTLTRPVQQRSSVDPG